LRCGFCASFCGGGRAWSGILKKAPLQPQRGGSARDRAVDSDRGQRHVGQHADRPAFKRRERAQTWGGALARIRSDPALVGGLGRGGAVRRGSKIEELGNGKLAEKFMSVSNLVLRGAPCVPLSGLTKAGPTAGGTAHPIRGGLDRGKLKTAANLHSNDRAGGMERMMPRSCANVRGAILCSVIAVGKVHPACSTGSKTYDALGGRPLRDPRGVSGSPFQFAGRRHLGLRATKTAATVRADVFMQTPLSTQSAQEIVPFFV